MMSYRSYGNDDEVEYDEVDSIGSGGYDWSQVSILRRKSDGELFWVSEGGCSCNSPLEYDTLDELGAEPLRRFDAFEQAVHELSDYYADSVEKVDGIRRARQLLEGNRG